VVGHDIFRLIAFSTANNVEGEREREIESEEEEEKEAGK
jgi:hypothetical protein